jgi:hypothetical protein
MMVKWFHAYGEDLIKLSKTEERRMLNEINRAHKKAGNPPIKDKIIGYNPHTKTLVTRSRGIPASTIPGSIIDKIKTPKYF